MRRHSGCKRRLPGPEAEPTGHVGAGEPAAALGEEERLLARIGGEAAAAFVEVAPQGALGRLPYGQQALLRALTKDPQLLGLEVERADVEVDDLLTAQPTRIGEL